MDRESHLDGSKFNITLKDLFKSYLKNTTLHGLKYIVFYKSSFLERLFWTLAFTCGIFTGMYLITDIFNKYNTNPVIVSFQPISTEISEIPFPALTICNMNKVLKSRADQYTKELNETSKFQSKPNPTAAEKRRRAKALKNMFYLDHVCSSTKSFSKIFNFSLEYGYVSLPNSVDISEVADPSLTSTDNESDQISMDAIETFADIFGERADVKEFLNHASQPCESMLKLCIWHEEVIDCNEIFKPIETDFGKCCVFNMVPPTLLDTLKNDSRDDPVQVHEWAKWNVNKRGLILSDEDNLIYPRKQIRAGKSYGLSFLLDPNMEQYFCTTSDSTGFRMVSHLPIEFPQVVDYGIAIKPSAEIFIGVRPEIVLSDPIIAEFPISKRECYFPGEYSLLYYNFYSASNCIDECVANETFRTCNCVSYYMPRDNTRKLCGPSNFECTRRVKKAFSATGKKALCRQCIPACTDIRYLLEVTETPLQNDHSIWIDNKNTSASWLNHNVSIVHIYFSQDSTYARLRKQLYGLTDLIANTGALMGLCLGFSGLSVAELLYFIILALIILCRQRNRKCCGNSENRPTTPAPVLSTDYLHNPYYEFGDERGRPRKRRNVDPLSNHSSVLHRQSSTSAFNPALILEKKFLSRFTRPHQNQNGGHNPHPHHNDDGMRDGTIHDAWTSRTLSPAFYSSVQRQSQSQNQGNNKNGEISSPLYKSTSMENLKNLQMRTDVLSTSISSYYDDPKNYYWNFNE